MSHLRSLSISHLASRLHPLRTGLPSIWLAYYQQAAQWNYTFDWNTLVTGFNADAAASFTASAFATGFAIPRVIEFVDVDGNRQYDPKVDTVASTCVFCFRADRDIYLQ
jgi:hypothetical protein